MFSFRRAVIAGAVGVLALVSTIGVAYGTAPKSATNVLLGQATVSPYDIQGHDFRVRDGNRSDFVTVEFVIDPGGRTGWHSHPGPGYIVVARGTLTLYKGSDPDCSPNTYGPNEGFVDPGFGNVHIARNEGTTQVVGYATYLNVPVGGSARIDQPRPENCKPLGI